MLQCNIERKLKKSTSGSVRCPARRGNARPRRSPRRGWLRSRSSTLGRGPRAERTGQPGASDRVSRDLIEQQDGGAPRRSEPARREREPGRATALSVPRSTSGRRACAWRGVSTTILSMRPFRRPPRRRHRARGSSPSAAARSPRAQPSIAIAARQNRPGERRRAAIQGPRPFVPALRRPRRHAPPSPVERGEPARPGGLRR